MALENEFVQFMQCTAQIFDILCSMCTIVHMKDIILSQKKERDELVQKPSTVREGLSEAKRSLNNQLIKVVVGPRRAGKSIFALQLLSGEEFSYINFDDERLQNITDADNLLQNMVAVYGKTPFVLFDEVQNFPKWELLVNRLQRQGLRLIITGSNSQMLSSELATHLTGRYLEHQILPFSFREFLEAKKIDVSRVMQEQQDQGLLLKNLDEFFLSGGFPEIVVDGMNPSPYLKTLYESVLLKDIVRRYNVRYVRQLSDLGHYLMTNHCSHITYSSLMKFLSFKSVHTIQKYMDYLDRSFLLFQLNRFSPKLKTQIKSSKKIYGIDQGMVRAVKFQHVDDATKILENVVAIELLRRREEFYYYFTTSGKEVDFLIKEGLQAKQLIQVSYDMTNSKTREREVRSLLAASKELGCQDLVILTWSQKKTEIVEKKKIQIIPVWEWIIKKS